MLPNNCFKCDNDPQKTDDGEDVRCFEYPGGIPTQILRSAMECPHFRKIDLHGGSR
jgi:hypothetical protein